MEREPLSWRPQPTALDVGVMMFGFDFLEEVERRLKALELAEDTYTPAVLNTPVMARDVEVP